MPTVLYLQEPNRLLYEAQFQHGGEGLPWVRFFPPSAARRGITGWRRRATLFAHEISKQDAMRTRARAEFTNARSFGVILCNSLFSREGILRSYGLDPKVCYLGIDIETFRPCVESKERFVVGLGSFLYHKGIDLAVRAIATIEPSARPDLIWIGNMVDQGHLRELAELANSLGVNLIPRIMVSTDELRDVLGRAAAMIYTSRLEPFGLAPLEANACGTAVVAVAEGGVRETVHDGINGMRVLPGDLAALGRALQVFTDDLEASPASGGSPGNMSSITGALMPPWIASNASYSPLAQTHAPRLDTSPIGSI